MAEDADDADSGERVAAPDGDAPGGAPGGATAYEARLRAAHVQPLRPLAGKIVIAPYSAEWPAQYAAQAAAIRAALGARVIRLEHAGSTSVPGLAAKPIIDIVLVIADPADEAAYVPALEPAAYTLHRGRAYAGDARLATAQR